MSASCLRPIKTTFFRKAIIFGIGTEGSTLEHRTNFAGLSSAICTILQFEIGFQEPFLSFVVTRHILGETMIKLFICFIILCTSSLVSCSYEGRIQLIRADLYDRCEIWIIFRMVEG